MLKYNYQTKIIILTIVKAVTTFFGLFGVFFSAKKMTEVLIVFEFVKLFFCVNVAIL